MKFVFDKNNLAMAIRFDDRHEMQDFTEMMESHGKVGHFVGQVDKKKIVCKDCGEEATNFHSRCCNAHFEGAVTPDGDLVIVCEKCGKFCAELKLR